MNALSRRLLLAGLLPAFAAACASAGAPAWADMDYPGTLQPATTLATDVLWQQRITAHWGEDGQRGFDAAVQKQGDTLTVLGLSPVGSVGFVMLLRGTAIELQNQSDQELPFPPRFILLDVQRTFYPWLAPAAGPDGARTGIVGDERVQELWRDGRLLQRRFTRLDGRPEGAITITYDWRDAEPQRLAPRHTVLDNGWFGYRLTVDTHTETLLPATAP
ncbi:MAG: DUF3261 domain-containing protein [Planctomycetes bacterium]|nr:DUF3261 domain-containing protein [Planctomycetota bacterium]